MMDDKQIMANFAELEASVAALKHANTGISSAASSDKSIVALEDNIFALQDQLAAIKSLVKDELRGVEVRVSQKATEAANKPAMSIAGQLADLVAEVEVALEGKIKQVDKKSQDRSMNASSTILKVSSLIEASAAISSNHIKSYLEALL